MAGTLHVRRSCDFSSLTSSAAHCRASGIFPASRKARALARAWLSADRSAADSFPDRASRAVRVPDDVLRIAAGPNGPTRFQRREISTVDAAIAMFIWCRVRGSKPSSRTSPAAPSRVVSSLRRGPRRSAQHPVCVGERSRRIISVLDPPGMGPSRRLLK